ncbi:MAG TPA: anthranilate phosphoribosyltransferase [Vicinamibacterales bacterium]|nr:anthranilate phosphoribosyltransferase [Vicinamibacterales bacterium]
MFPELLEKLRRHEDLTTEEAARAMGAIMDGQAQPSQIAALLVGLTLKGERPTEVVGFATAMRQRATPLPAPVGAVFDTCGTGGDGAHTFNVSTAAALIVAGSGVRVAKHGNRAASSKCGSADVFEALGIGLDGAPDRVIRSLDRAKLAFFFAQAWHPSMKHAAPTRKELGIRTAFNLLGPLTNPARPARQLIGVSRPEHTELLARALGELGSERAWVVYGAGGLDEISTLGHTKVSELHRGTVNTFYVHPADAGLPIASVADLRGGSAAENAAMIEDVVGGGQGPRRDIALLNAGASLLIAGVASSLRDGVERAAKTIADGGARRVLAELREVSPK